MKTSEEILKSCITLLQKKDKEYRNTEDPFENFNETAKLNHCTKEQALWGFVSKQIISLASIIRTEGDYSKIEEKAMDVINYMTILMRMAEMTEEKRQIELNKPRTFFFNEDVQSQLKTYSCDKNKSHVKENHSDMDAIRAHWEDPDLEAKSAT